MTVNFETTKSFLMWTSHCNAKVNSRIALGGHNSSGSLEMKAEITVAGKTHQAQA